MKRAAPWPRPGTVSGRRLPLAGACLLLLVLLLVAWGRLSGGRERSRAAETNAQAGSAAEDQPGGTLWARAEGRRGDGAAPSGSGRQRPLSPEAHAALQRGVAALEQGRLDPAVKAFERAVRLDPRSALARDYLGIAYLKQRRFADALRQFKEEIRLDPDPSTGWARVADVYYAQGSPREAVAALERAVARRPDLAQLHLNLSMLHLQTMDLGKAVAALQRCVGLEPRNHYAHYLLGNELFKLARLDEAERALQEAIRLDPHVGLYHFGLAQVYLRRQGSPAVTRRAREELERALKLGVPEPAAAHYHLGLCYQREGQWEAARRELETAVNLAPEAWAAYYALQEVLLRLGRTAEARAALARFRLLRAREDARMQRSFFFQEAQRNPGSAAAHLQLAEFLARHGERKPAQQSLARARRLADAAQVAPDLRRRIAVLGARMTAPGGQSRARW